MHSAQGILFAVDGSLQGRMSIGSMAASNDIQCELFSSGEQFLDYYRPELAGCVLIDVELEGMNGLQLHERLVGIGCILPVIFTISSADVPSIVKGMKNGALTFIQKPYQDGEMADAVRKGFQSNALDRELLGAKHDVRCSLDKLDSRERRLVELVLAGVPNKRIAFIMGISLRTVDRVRACVFKKMNAKSAVELAHIVAQCGFPNTHLMNCIVG
jgi:two-component system, LuxR family, response regulator DctR